MSAHRCQRHSPVAKEAKEKISLGELQVFIVTVNFQESLAELKCQHTSLLHILLFSVEKILRYLK